MKNKTNQKHFFDDINVQKFLVIFIPVFASSVLAIAFGVSVFVHPEYRDIDGSLGIISLAVAVWTGINIANVIERNEVEKIRRKLDSAEIKIQQSEENLKKVEEISRKLDSAEIKIQQSEENLYKSEEIINSLRDSKRLREEIDRKEFLYVLESADDIFYQYLSNMYKEDDEDNHNVPSELNAETLRIIKGILHIRSLHENGNDDIQKHIFDYSEELIRQIDEIISKIPTCLTKNVLTFIKGEAFFYGAFALYHIPGNSDKYCSAAKHFFDAAKTYENESLMRFFLVGAPEIINCYYYNTVAQCYSEILFCSIKSKDDDNSSKRIASIIKLSDAKDKVINYSKKATDDSSLSKYPFSRERYYKNSGVAKERIADAFGENYIQDLTEAIKDYETAESHGEQNKTGYVLCSAYNKYIKKLIRPDEIDFITPKCETSLWEKGQIDDNDKVSFTTAYKRLRVASNKWRQINPTQTMFNCLYIMSYLYEGLLVDDLQKETILNKTRLDVEEIKLIAEEDQTTLMKVVVNVFDRIDASFKLPGDENNSNGG